MNMTSIARLTSACEHCHSEHVSVTTDSLPCSCVPVTLFVLEPQHVMLPFLKKNITIDNYPSPPFLCLFNMTTADTVFLDSINGPARSKGWDYTCVSLTPIRWLHTVIDWLLPMNTSFEFQGSTQHTPSHAHTNTRRSHTGPLLFPSHFISFFFFPSVPLLLSLLLWLSPLTLLPFPKASFKECTHHFITLMNLVGFSRRGRPPVMQRQMPPVPPVSRFLCLRWCGGTGWLKEG